MLDKNLSKWYAVLFARIRPQNFIIRAYENNMNTMMDLLLGGFVNWKTTITGVATGVLILLSGLGYIHISDSERQTVIGALLILFSWFVKDANQTGKPTDKL